MARLPNEGKKCESKFENQEHLLEAYRTVVSDMNSRIMELESANQQFPKPPKFHLVVA
jgi:exonuclease VII small subunit